MKPWIEPRIGGGAAPLFLLAVFTPVPRAMFGANVCAALRTVRSPVGKADKREYAPGEGRPPEKEGKERRDFDRKVTR